MTKPWIDICTTGIPRLTTLGCMTSFVEHCTDRSDYRLRWLFHLDNLNQLSAHYDATLKLAHEAAALFDEADIEGSPKNIGYGGSVLRQLQKCRNPVLWIEDDKAWCREWSIGTVVNATEIRVWHGWMRTKYAINVKTPVGFTTAPSFWPPRVWQGMLENFPMPPRQQTEKSLMVVAKRLKFASTWVSSDLYWRDCGRRASSKCGWGYHNGPHRKWDHEVKE